MRSMPAIIPRKIANIAIPITIATASMKPSFPLEHHAGITMPAPRITISLRRYEGASS
jgi:hypothetical protein